MNSEVSELTNLFRLNLRNEKAFSRSPMISHIQDLKGPAFRMNSLL